MKFMQFAPYFKNFHQALPRFLGAVLLALLVVLLVVPDYVPSLTAEPFPSTTWFQDSINAWVGAFVDWAKPLLRVVSQGIEGAVRALQFVLHHIPFLSFLAVVAWVGWRLGGVRLGVLSGGAILYMAFSGLWLPSMNTLAMVGIAIPLALSFGFILGVLGAKSRQFGRVLEPCLDMMQTVPTFAYLVPLIVLFGFGPVPGVVASMIYAAPPMTRNVMLGLQLVPHDVRDVARMSGAGAWQSFTLIELPSAKSQILVGINQSVLASLSMVIIAAVIGGFDDIGRAVLLATNKGSARFGEALSAGAIIVLMAIVIDQITRGASIARPPAHTQTSRRWGLGVAALVFVLGYALPLAGLVAVGADYFRLTESAINSGLSTFIGHYGIFLDSFKNQALIYILLPLRLGLDQAISPFTWGINFAPEAQIAYLLAVIGGGLALLWRGRKISGVFLLIAGLVLFRGITDLPWLVVTGGVCFVAWRVRDVRLAVMCFAMLSLIVLFGHWGDALYSLYLCSAAVFLCVLLGCPLGILAAKSSRVSGFLRPLSDTLQSIPLYIFLIPAVALFQISEFSALVSIVLYAIVPMIRYTEHALRGLPPSVLESATAQGCTGWQKLLYIELPMARPRILLGLNQTILFALAMLIIAVLVGARGLAEQVNIGLRNADSGLGLTAGLSMAFLAMMADRILRGLVRGLG